MIGMIYLQRRRCFIKVFGSNSNSRKRDKLDEKDILPEESFEENQPKKHKKKKKKNRKLRVITVLLCIVLFFEALYCFLVFTDISSIQYLR